MKAHQLIHFKDKKHRYNEELLAQPPRHVREEVQVIIDALHKSKAKAVLDFGSGNGRLTIPLLQAGFIVTAVDISKESLDQLMAEAQKAHCARSLSLATRFPHAHFDAVVGTDILHHVDIDSTLQKVHTVLKKNGIIFFSEPNILNLSWIVFISLFLDWRVEGGVIFCNYITLNHLLKKHHFHAVTLAGHGLFPPPLFNSMPVLQKMNYHLGALPFLRRFAYRLMISAR
jgi:2-polyprenyl-3-methyl-5-hydroxy-6-metoxy-1,4-benzoquinol methylase